ncbi:DNA-directed RNA polymerase subunit alpha C-terminal domain-containing protein [Variovorax sp. PBL-E5]|uniref:DNA-directed RNA polymerase subunit alpha C-terminal domain-containing protein n=1 Tax=Variovorax sp. PBL-E5 TaxID=434014 RepID=UPI00131784F6|nr:DNA-directed RNA polymerase subunit alpha C-terminal domain-containing protein [Variovorax sp. PBL-E5]VTU38512.1 DNA-directed RNA polymerase subunit alpha [Variovorax sp. PBL-E5]
MSLCVVIYSLFEGELRLDRFTKVDDVSQALDRLFARPGGRVAIDLAFDPLPSNVISGLLGNAECRVCASERVIPLLAESIVSDTSEAGLVGHVKFYAAFPAPQSREGRSLNGRESGTGWLASLSVSDRELQRQLVAVGIGDERSYQANEHLLPPHLRVAAARTRYMQLAGAPPDPVEILDNLNACPPWVVGARLKDLPLSVRQANVLRAYSLRTVGEVSRFGNSGLLKLPNLGLKSVRELGVTIYELMLREPAIGSSTIGALNGLAIEIPLPHADGSFIEMLRDELRGYGGIAEVVLLERWGLLGERSTLQQLAEKHGLTRERIRQIEVKTAERLRGAGVWVTFSQHVDGLLDSRETPLWMDRLPAEDPWFGDDAWLTHGLATCIELFLGPRFHLVEIKQRPAVSALAPTEWRRIIEDCKLILGPELSHDEDRVWRLAAAVLVEKGSELRGELVSHLTVPSETDSEAELPAVDPDVALSRQLERALLEQTLLRIAES